MKKVIASLIIAAGMIAPGLALAASNLPPIGYIPPVVKCTLTASPSTLTSPVTATSTTKLTWTTTNAVTTAWSGSTNFTSSALSGTATVPLTNFLSMFFITAVGKYGLGVAICEVNVTAPLFK